MTDELAYRLAADVCLHSDDMPAYGVCREDDETRFYRGDHLVVYRYTALVDIYLTDKELFIPKGSHFEERITVEECGAWEEVMYVIV